MLGELLAGLEAGRQARHDREELDLLRGSPRVRLVSIGEATAERYAVIYAGLRSAGKTHPDQRPLDRGERNGARVRAHLGP